MNAAGLFGHAQAGQRVQGERRVPDPGVPVVPVAYAADRLGEPEGRGGHDRAAPPGVEQLQRQRGAVDLVSPAAAIGGVADPLAPEVHGGLEGLRDVRVEIGGVLRVPRHLLQDEGGSLPRGQHELADRIGALDPKWYGGRQPQNRAVRAGEHDAVLHGLGRVGRTGVVEAGCAPDPIPDLAPNGLDPAHDAARVLAGVHRHEVGDLPHALGGQESGEQEVGVGQVQLLVPRLIEVGRDREATALVGVEQAREHRGRIEVGQTEEVDRPVERHQRGRLEVADDGVRLDRGVPTVTPPLPPSRPRRPSRIPVPAFRHSEGLLRSIALAIP